MAHPLLHAKSSVKKWGGKVEDYIEIHNWFDETKSWIGSSYHRMMRHHSEGIFEMEKIRLEDEQAQHKETQETIRAGDKADDKFIRWTRPGMSWCGLGLAAAYVINIPDANEMIFYGIMALPYSYMGLREFGKWAQLQSKEKK